MVRKPDHRIPTGPFHSVSQATKIVLAFLLLICLIPAVLLTDVKQAEALTVEAVTQKEFSDRNGVSIQNLKPSLVQPAEFVSATTNTKCSSTVKGPIDDLGGSWSDFYKVWNDISYNRKYTYYAMATANCSTGMTIEFPDLTKAGDQGSVTVKYPRVGTYNGSKIGAEISYKVTYDPEQWIDEFGNTETSQIKYPWIQLSDLLFNGVRQSSCLNVDVHVDFYDSATWSQVKFENSWFSIGSLNPWSTTSISASGNAVIGSEQVRVKQSDTNKIEYRSDGIISVHQNADYAIAYSDKLNSDWVDTIEHDRFTKATAVIYQDGAFNFSIRGGSHLPRQFVMKRGVWWTLSSSSLSNQYPDKPVKTVDKSEASPGDTLKYSVSQTVNDLGVDGVTRYASMKMVDFLPECTTYTGGAKMIRTLKDGTESNITASAGSFDYNSADHTLTYTFDAAYLESMPLRGETYTMKFQVLADGKAANIAENKATSHINTSKFEADPVSTLINSPQLALEKSVDAYEHEVGDTAEYSLKISNTEAGTYEKNIVITDSSLPSGLTLDPASISLAGLPSTVEINSVENGNVVKKSFSNTYTIVPSGNGFSINIDYLPSGHDVYVSYNALVTEPVNGSEVPNTASAQGHYAASPVQSTAYEWNNSAQLSLQKSSDSYEYRVGDTLNYTLILENTAQGSIAREIVLDETSFPPA